jgi:diketogulonate reductase-like aldo/keto reductase
MGTIDVGGLTISSFMYGTAWKEDDTRRLVRLALDAGFRSIDTANQRRHYHEGGVGEALAEAFAAGVLTRDEVFLQTKFTYVDGQDHRLPYDPKADYTTQVNQSFASSLEHLGVERLDSYVLHGPLTRHGFAAGDWEVWKAMESLHADGKTRLLGVSNVAKGQLEALCAGARVQPSFVQNRCYARRGWDREVRALCRDRGIVYQGFSLLTANRTETASAKFKALVARVGKTPSQVVFRFALQVGMLPLTGTTDPAHMAEDLGVYGFELSDADVAEIEGIGT